MTFDEFAKLREQASPPPLPSALVGLWHDYRDDWDGAHRAVQADEGREAAWVHAYLHRKEGDLSNADYWYRRAGREAPAVELDDEREAIARALLAAT